MVKCGDWGCRPKPCSSHITHQCHTYTRCLTTFICCGCAYGWVPTILRQLMMTNGPTPNRSHLNVIHMQGGWEPSYAVDGHMDLSSLSRPRSHWSIFGSQAWILGNCQATICRVVWCLRLWTHSKQIPHQCHIYARCLRTFICCGWAHGPVLTH